MKKKYTMQEIKEMFDIAKIKVLDKMDKDFEEKSEVKDGMAKFAWSMQNMIVLIELEHAMFGDDKNDTNR